MTTATTRVRTPCPSGCRSILLTRGGSRPECRDRDAYTCFHCRSLVCALCGTTRVRWAGYICGPCVAPVPSSMTAKQLRSVLADVDDDHVLYFETPGRTQWILETPTSRNLSNGILPLLATSTSAAPRP